MVSDRNSRDSEKGMGKKGNVDTYLNQANMKRGDSQDKGEGEMDHKDNIQDMYVYCRSSYGRETSSQTTVAP